MTHRHARVALAALALGVLGGVLTLPAQGPITPAPAFSPEALTALPEANWPTNGGDLFNRRFSPLREITAGNVANLRAVWRARLDGSALSVWSVSSTGFCKGAAST